MSALQAAKLWLIGLTGLGKDALHIYVGLALFLGSAVLFKWSLASWKPLAIVLAAALLGVVPPPLQLRCGLSSSSSSSILYYFTPLLPAPDNSKSWLLFILPSFIGSASFCLGSPGLT